MTKENQTQPQGLKAVSMDVAQEEVNKWLDYKKVGDKQRESQQDMIDLLQDAICEGLLTLDPEKYFFHQTLKLPIQDDNGNDILSEIKYRPRINEHQLTPFLKGVKATDIKGMITAYVAALSSQNNGMIKRLDTEDRRIADAIAIFFL